MEVERKDTNKLDYPLRPQRLENRNYQPVPLVSNHYWVRFEPTHKIFIYSVDFDPKIGADVRSLKQRIFLSDEVFRALSAEIGFYILTGSTVFGAKVPSFQESITFPTSFDGKNYSIKITLRRTFSISDIFSDDKKVSSPAFKFFNILVKHVLRSMKLLEFGRSSKYFNLEKSASIPDTNLRIFHGYLTSFNHYESGFYLKIDVSHKIIRTETVLNYIDDVYSKNSHLPKDEKRQKVKESLVGKTVLAMYGNYRYWRIDDIIFDKDCDTFEFEDDKTAPFQSANDPETKSQKKSFTITQYYKERYNMKLSKPRQPLILHNQTKTGKIFYIIPEFCVMTGIPEDMNDFTRKKVTDLCIKQPHQRMKEIQNLVESMLKPVKDEYTGDGSQNSQRNNSLAAIKGLGIEFQGGPVFFEGKQLPTPKILLGNGATAEERGGNFQIKREIYEPGGEITWAILCSQDFRAERMLEQFDSLSKSLGVKLAEPRIYDYGRKEEGKKAIIEIESLLEKKIPGRFDIVIIVLPNNMKSYYKAIKQKCYLTLGILSQVVLYNTLEKKGFFQICSKLLQQIISKVGSKLWVAQPPKGLNPQTMLIGIDSSSDKADKGKNVIAFCASMDRTFTRYYNRVIYQKKSEDIVSCMKSLIKESIVAYQKINNDNCPEHVIYFRDGVIENVEKEIQAKEVPDIRQAFVEQTREKLTDPKITVVVIDKRITQKFFSVTSNKQLENPLSGTLVDNTIVSKYYDFYLIAQNVTRGTATPTHYKVIYDNSGMPAEVLQELVYSQCFAYMNWSGAIRIPAPCQYAHKLSAFISQHVNDEPVKQLRTHFYYL